MTLYSVLAKRWARGWELHIDGVGVTQSSSLREAEPMVRDYIALDTGEGPDSFDVVITPQVGHGLDEETLATREAVAGAEEARRYAAARSRTTASRLRDAGLSGRDIAVVLGISPQRVSQLLKRPAADAGQSPHRARAHSCGQSATG